MTFTLDTIGLTLEFIGTILIVYTVLRVHTRVVEERQIDPKVVTEVTHERKAAFLGIILIGVGYTLQLLGA